MSDTVEFVKREKVGTKNLIPPEYVKVALSSVGKLNLPSTIHVKNYSGQDTLDLALSNMENLMSTTVMIMDKLIYEDIEDIELMHYNELEEIMFNIYSIFWGKELNGIDYPYEEDELLQIENDTTVIQERKDLVEKIRKEDFTPKVTIPLEKIKTMPLDKDFKEPFYISNQYHKVGMRLPRIKDLLETQRYLDEKYAQEKQLYYGIESLVKKGKDTEARQYRDYSKYQKYVHTLNMEYGIMKQSLLLVSFDGEELDTIEKKVEAYDKIDLKIWKAFTNQVVEKYDFGVQDEIRLISPITQEEVIRRFQFRLLDYFPDMDDKEDAGVTVCFGD